jgi:tetratricopeptide (TPR) repeat protein
MVSTRYGRVTVRSGDEEVVSEAEIGPSLPVRASFTDSVAVSMDGRLVYEGPLPVVLDRDSTRLPAIRRAAWLSWGGGGRRREDLQKPGAEIYYRNIELEGHQARWQTLSCFAALFADIDQTTGFEPSMSLANACYRLGRFTFARIHLAIAARASDADSTRIAYLQGLMDWELGDTVELSDAGVRGNYHRAMLALREGEQERAIELLEAYLAWHPRAYRPRLMLAYLTGNLGMAARCLDENPGSPEALCVMAELGYGPARADLETLVSTGTGADVALDNFLDEIKHGQWRHGRRYEHSPETWGATMRLPEELKY